MGATAPRERIIADNQFGGGTPANWYLALSTTTPNDDGTGFTEPSGLGYTRVTVANNTTSFGAAQTVAGDTTKTNAIKLTFPNPTGTWGLIVAYGWFDVATAGTVQFFNPLDASITVRNGNTPVEFDINQLVMSWE